MERVMKFLVPQGIGDSVWALIKMQSIMKQHGADKAHVYLNCSRFSEAECRSLEFVQRFDFVEKAEMLKFNILDEPFIDTHGRYNYIRDGWRHIDTHEAAYVLMPNHPLERGIALGDWLPQFECNWDIAKHFKFREEEILDADRLHAVIGDYAVFFMGSLASNTTSGHNRGTIWTHTDWINLGNWLHERYGLNIVVVGAPYDLDLYNGWIHPNVKDKKWWHSTVGKMGIGSTFATCKRAKLVISYQSGVGIFSHYMNVPLGIFWRQKGDSVSPNHYISFDESMASAWANPRTLGEGRHMSLIYGKHDLEYVKNEIDKRGWVNAAR